MGAFTQALLPLGTRTVSETPVLCHFKLDRLAAHRSDLPGLPPRQRLEDTKLGRGACASSPQGFPAQEEPSPRAFCIHPLGPHNAAVFTQAREGTPRGGDGPGQSRVWPGLHFLLHQAGPCRPSCQQQGHVWLFRFTKCHIPRVEVGVFGSIVRQKVGKNQNSSCKALQGL